jgi:hypothetical protein
VRDEDEKFEVICDKKDGEMELSVFEIKKKRTWVVVYSFLHHSNETFYSLRNGIGFIGGEGVLFEVNFSITAPTTENGTFTESNVYVNVVDGKSEKKVVKMGNVTLGKVAVIGKEFQDFEKLLMSIQLPDNAKKGEYEGMITITLD